MCKCRLALRAGYIGAPHTPLTLLSPLAHSSIRYGSMPELKHDTQSLLYITVLHKANIICSIISSLNLTRGASLRSRRSRTGLDPWLQLLPCLGAGAPHTHAQNIYGKIHTVRKLRCFPYGSEHACSESAGSYIKVGRGCSLWVGLRPSRPTPANLHRCQEKQATVNLPVCRCK
jgi:hypothetical protein